MVVYLKNRPPVKALKKTQFEVWHGNKPRVNHLRVFGSDAYAHVPRDEKHASVLWWDTEMSQKVTGCMISHKERYGTRQNKVYVT